MCTGKGCVASHTGQPRPPESASFTFTVRNVVQEHAAIRRALNILVAN